MSRRFPSERGASAVEFALVFLPFVGIVGIALYLSYFHQVRSDLQRAAEKTALYAATHCDPRALGCTDPNAYPTQAQILAFAQAHFSQGVAFTPETTSNGAASCPLSGNPAGQSHGATICEFEGTTNLTVGSTPGVNQQLRFLLTYHYNSPFGGLLSALGMQSYVVDMTADGRAVVE